MRTDVRTPELELTHGVKVPTEEDRTMTKRSRPLLSSGELRGGCPLRLGIADDHVIVREGLKSVLSGLPDIEVVGEASDGREAIELARQVKMDVLLMDLAMPNRGGLDVKAQ
jgi:PleD family two-component response regulator